MHLVAGMMQFDTLKKTDVFYTLTGKSAETDTSEGVRGFITSRLIQHEV